MVQVNACGSANTGAREDASYKPAHPEIGLPNLKDDLEVEEKRMTSKSWKGYGGLRLGR
jgi:hypothetical protein